MHRGLPARGKKQQRGPPARGRKQQRGPPARGRKQQRGKRGQPAIPQPKRFMGTNGSESIRDESSAALLVGIEYTNYAKRKIMDRLPGCHRDVHQMKDAMIYKYGVPPPNIKVLVDDGRPGGIPSKQNILKGLNWLLSSGKKHLWFTYSGHGSYQKDRSGDEPDGKDETLVPADFKSAGMIVDDTIRALLLQKLPEETSFIAIYDQCHSGSVSDLPISFSCRNPGVAVKASRDQSLSTKSGQILSLSACADSQTSVSAYNLQGAKKWQGALTYAFSKLPAGNLKGDNVLKRINRIIKQRRFSQITTLSTNRNTTTHANQINFPFPI